MNDMMRREIEAQGVILKDIQPAIARAADAIPAGTGRVFAGGCGDSAYAPRALSGVFDKLGQPFIARSAMELAAFTTYRSDDTVILSSISGGTKRTLHAAETARQAGARVIAITCNTDSALASTAHAVIPLPYRPMSRKTPHTLDYSVTLLALVELARSFADEAEDASLPILSRIPEMLATTGAAAMPVVREYDPAGKIFILGVGPNLGTSEYAAAKFQEAGGLIAMAAETENFAHGMNFMLEPGDTIIALGGTEAGLIRARQIVNAMDGLAVNGHVFPGQKRPQADWQSALLALFEQTFFVQHTCLGIADRLSLRLEEPRAGRSGGPTHNSIQQRMMAD